LKKIILDHPFTPVNLRLINQELNQFFLLEEPDEKLFLDLANRRDSVVQSHLATLDGKDKKHFSQAELEVNGTLVAYANKLFKASLNQLSGLIRGRKAVKKYT